MGLASSVVVLKLAVVRVCRTFSSCLLVSVSWLMVSCSSLPKPKASPVTFSATAGLASPDFRRKLPPSTGLRMPSFLIWSAAVMLSPF